MKALIIGLGEVGKAHFDVLSRVYCDIYWKDVGDDVYDAHGKIVNIQSFDLMLVATQCDPDNMGKFTDMVIDYDTKFNPSIIDILTTTPPTTAEKLQTILGKPVCKSTIRGMHGDVRGLASFLLDIPKHIGGEDEAVETLARFYSTAGIECVTHSKARATELFHELNNSDYGVAVMKAQENYDLCRAFGVDYMEYLEYKKTNNSGFIKAGYPSKVSPILTPPNGPIGGHCVVYSATCIPERIRGPLMWLLAKFNDKFKAPVKMDKN